MSPEGAPRFGVDLAATFEIGPLFGEGDASPGARFFFRQEGRELAHPLGLAPQSVRDVVRRVRVVFVSLEAIGLHPLRRLGRPSNLLPGRVATLAGLRQVALGRHLAGQLESGDLAHEIAGARLEIGRLFGEVRFLPFVGLELAREAFHCLLRNDRQTGGVGE